MFLSFNIITNLLGITKIVLRKYHRTSPIVSVSSVVVVHVAVVVHVPSVVGVRRIRGRTTAPQGRVQILALTLYYIRIVLRARTKSPLQIPLEFTPYSNP